MRFFSRLVEFSPILTSSSQAFRVLSFWIMELTKRLVYVMTNGDDSPRFYVGLTSDVNARLEDHNAGRCPHTAAHRPWRVHVVIEFSDQATAVRFERYLKSGSGRAFAKRHFESQAAASSTSVR